MYVSILHTRKISLYIVIKHPQVHITDMWKNLAINVFASSGAYVPNSISYYLDAF